MLENIFLIFILGFVAFIPILLWGYFFGYIDSDTFNRKRFFMGILAGGISVFPVLFLGEIADSFSFQMMNIFGVVHDFAAEGSIFQVFLSFIVLFAFFSFIPFVLFYLTPISKEKLKLYCIRFGIFSFYFVLISFLFYLINSAFLNFDFLQIESDLSISFGDIVFNSVKLVIFYYLLIGILEELSKFLFFSYEKNFSLLSVKHGVISAIFIALGFAFIENILYFYSLYHTYGFGQQLMSTYFLRNIFSVFLHILCSSIFAYYFSKLYLSMKNQYNFYFIKTLLIGFFISFTLHALFDIFLTFDLMFFVFLYIIGGYFYLTYIFYKE